uniref:Uncharacterized protein n=1 Tax=Oryza glumipatula TaxID=40148 RepID=A0A0E0B7L5_9ORYZ
MADQSFLSYPAATNDWKNKRTILLTRILQQNVDNLLLFGMTTKHKIVSIKLFPHFFSHEATQSACSGADICPSLIMSLLF